MIAKRLISSSTAINRPVLSLLSSQIVLINTSLKKNETSIVNMRNHSTAQVNHHHQPQSTINTQHNYNYQHQFQSSQSSGTVTSSYNASQQQQHTPAHNTQSNSQAHHADPSSLINVPVLKPNEYRFRDEDAYVQNTIDSIVRVDHAGEYGAVRIYDGQLAVIQDPALRQKIQEMREQELRHLNHLQNMIPQRRVRPTLLLPFWHVAGFALGAATALIGPRAAFACTVAVEEAITEHYDDQLRTLHEQPFQKTDNKLLKQVIKANRDDEEEHRQIGLQNEAEQAPLYSGISNVIKAGCKAAIWFSSRI